MDLRGSHLILLVSIVFPTTMSITFTLAVCCDHVYPIMPFMSYTGDLPVESCIFSLGLNFVAFLYIIIISIRYNQIINFCQDQEFPHSNAVLRLNRNSLWWGVASSLGLSATGSFQEINLATVHKMAALGCTYCGFIFMWFQTVMSDLLVGRLNSKKVFRLRLCLSSLSTVIHVVAPFMVIVLELSYPKRHLDSMVWSMKEEGWHLHVGCSFLEWVVFAINVTYVASYYTEFKEIRIKSDEIVFVGHGRRQERLLGVRAESSGRKKSR